MIKTKQNHENPVILFGRLRQEDPQVQIPPSLQNTVKANLGNVVRPYFKKKKLENGAGTRR